MEHDYTAFNEHSLENFASSDETDSAADFLRDKKNFRPFNHGLTELLQKVNFHGDISSVPQKTAFLAEKLRAIDSSLTTKTIQTWFAGERRPKIEPHSRLSMYEICFALNLNLEQVKWFFHHVYFDRAFNCHNITEAVYFFAFRRKLSFAEANEIVAEIVAADVENTDDDAIYTQLIKDRISSLTTIDELKFFLIQNKKSFTAWNKSALKQINIFLAEIIGNEAVAEPIIHKLKRATAQSRTATVQFNEDAINKCGLLVRHICFQARQSKNSGGKYSAEKIDDAISNRNVFSVDFVLANFLGLLKGIDKKVDVPYVVKNNFPSKKVLSEVLNSNKSAVSKSYDAIRKTLILLHFHCFWYKVELDDAAEYESEDLENLPEIYRDEADLLLEQCGYETLFAGNPYDWIFLCSANARNTQEPENFSYALDFFADLICALT